MNDPQIVRCPYCQNTVQVAAHLVGNAVSCPYCQQAIQVAATSVADQAVAGQPFPGPSTDLDPIPLTTKDLASSGSPASRPTNSNRGFYTIIAIAIASVSLLLLLGAGLFSWYMMSSNAPGKVRDARDLRGAELDEFYEQEELERIMSGEDESADNAAAGGLNSRNAK